MMTMSYSLLVLALASSINAILSNASKTTHIRLRNDVNSEEKIVAEIKKMEELRIRFIDKKQAISNFKNFTHTYREGLPRYEITKSDDIEINPSLIHKYNLRQFNYDEINKGYRNFDPIITPNMIYREVSARVKWINENDPTTNIIEMVYKVYVHRKKLERQLEDIVKQSGCEIKENYDEILLEMNKKIEMLYEKYAEML